VMLFELGQVILRFIKKLRISKMLLFGIDTECIIVPYRTFTRPFNKSDCNFFQDLLKVKEPQLFQPLSKYFLYMSGTAHTNPAI
jgi:hypothetical protein